MGRGSRLDQGRGVREPGRFFSFPLPSSRYPVGDWTHV